MATNKTLTPTNVTISIPEFTDQPDQRVNSNCIDKEADAINALDSGKAGIFYAGTVTSTTPMTLTVTGSTRLLLVAMSSSQARCGLYYIYTSSTGLVSSYQMIADSVLTVSSSQNYKLSITSSSSSTTTISFIVLNGSISA